MKIGSEVTALFDVDFPIVQGPFGGGLSTVQLASKVSNLGGLGSYGAHVLEPDGIEELGRELRSHTERSFAINLWVSDWDPEMDGISGREFAALTHEVESYYHRFGLEKPAFTKTLKSEYERQVEAVLRVRPKVFSFVFGIPTSDVLKECRRLGIVTMGAATTIAEALEVEAAGVDVVLVSGAEAGGHRPWFREESREDLVGTFPLIPIVRDRVKIPVVAAGGIVDARGVRAALALGADAVQVGTAFLATEESGALALHKQRLLEDGEGRTRLSRAFTGRWARFMPNSILDGIDGKPDLVLPFPAQAWALGPIKRAAAEQQDGSALPLYASQAVPLVKERSVDAVFEDLKAGLQSQGFV